MKSLDRALPFISLLLALLGWEVLVRWAQIPHYTLPAPSRVLATLWAQGPDLAGAWWNTVRVTVLALLLATGGGALLAVAFALSRTVERALWPFAVVLQVTPLVAVAPLILIYVDDTTTALLLCAWIVAFFPMLANTRAGLAAADPQLQALFTLYGATRWQRLRWLLLPTALPYFLSGLRICGGLSLIASVTAEMVAGAAGHDTGLAARILEASFRTDTPKMFAALLLLVLTGLVVHAGLAALSRGLLRHARRADRTSSF